MTPSDFGLWAVAAGAWVLVLSLAGYGIYWAWVYLWHWLTDLRAIHEAEQEPASISSAVYDDEIVDGGKHRLEIELSNGKTINTTIEELGQIVIDSSKLVRGQ